jgi:FAD/FMN-containing dehydrogenase
MPTRSKKVAAPKKNVAKKTTVKKTAVKRTVKKSPMTVKHVHEHTASVLTRSLHEKKILSERRQPLGHLLLEQKLRDAGFKGIVTSDKKILDAYSTDESIFSIRPQIVLQPKHQRDVEVAVALVASETKRFASLSLTPRAAGTGLGGGSLTDSVVIDVSRFMHNIGSVETRSGIATFTCEPGALWRDVERMLKHHDLYLPSYPASKDICSIGGAVANNAAGPDSLRFGHTADWVESLSVVLHDGKTYTIAPLSYKELKALLKKDDAYATMAREVFSILEANEKTILNAKPKTTKNSAGYALWDVLSTSLANFKKGHGTFDLTRIISGSQGTIGIITAITMRAEPIAHDTDLIVVPVFDLLDAGAVIEKALEFNPINIELFDGLTFDLALKNPQFFKDRLGMLTYYKVMLSMYTTYHVRYARRTPEFTLLITLNRDDAKLETDRAVTKLRGHHGKYARKVVSPIEREMFWQIRRASYTLSKFQDPEKRPAAFLEDMVVPTKNLSKFFAAIKKLLNKYNVTAAVHGHGGNGHLHFYPLLDFTNKTTPALVMKMTEDFFNAAIELDGNLCGEHNDGIIRTPHLDKLFTKTVLDLFKRLEHACDPDDIFNPGKKVNPRFDIKASIRHTN